MLVTKVNIVSNGACLDFFSKSDCVVTKKKKVHFGKYNWEAKMFLASKALALGSLITRPVRSNKFILV